MRKKVKKRERTKEEKIKFLDRRISLNQKVQNFILPFYGVEKSSADRLSSQLGVLYSFQSFRLPRFIWSKLERELDRNYVIGRLCEKEKKERLDEYQKMGCYRGLRFSQGLPVRGQRTHTNARTMKRKYGKKNVQVQGKGKKKK